MNVYELSRNFWDFSFENPEKIKPNHAAMYFFVIEHCNRLGWKEKFGLPTVMVKDAIGIKSYNTYIKTLNELVEFGFITMIEKSKNQYSANIIALSKNYNAPNKALDKAIIKHVTKQSESTVQSTGESIDSINKPIYNNTNLPIQKSTIDDNDDVDDNYNEEEIEEQESDIVFIDGKEFLKFKGLLFPKSHIKHSSTYMSNEVSLQTFMQQNKIKSDDVGSVKALLMEFNKHLNIEGKHYEESKFKDYRQHFTNWYRRVSPEMKSSLKTPKKDKLPDGVQPAEWLS